MIRTLKKSWLLAAVFALTLGVAGCELDGDDTADMVDAVDTNMNPASAEVSVGINDATPGTVTIRPGGSVTFTNNADREVVISFGDPSIADTGIIAIGASTMVTFPSSGSFAWTDVNNGNVSGVVVVE